MSSLDGQGDYVSSGSWSFEAREKEVRGSLVFNGAINNLLFGGPGSNLRDNLPLSSCLSDLSSEWRRLIVPFEEQDRPFDDFVSS
jgi:hypothetical protein